MNTAELIISILFPLALAKQYTYTCLPVPQRVRASVALRTKYYQHKPPTTCLALPCHSKWQQ